MASGDTSAAKEELSFLRSTGAELPELAWNAELVDGFLIRTLYEAGEWKRLGNACGEWLRQRGSSPLIHAFYSEALRRQGRLDLAENHARRAIERGSAEPDLHCGLVAILWEAKKWDALRTALKAASRHGGDRTFIDRFSALLAAETDDDLQSVIEKLQSAIRESGPIPLLMFVLARSYLRIGLADLAESWYRKTLALDPKHEEASLGLIASLQAQEADGSFEASRRLPDAYRDYLDQYPDNPRILREYALLLVRKDRFREAVGRLEALLAWEPQNLSLRRLLAYSYRKTGHFREAAIFLRDILRERPKDAKLLLELSFCLTKSGAAEYAENLLRTSIPLFQKNGDIHLALATILLKRKKKEEAMERLRESAALSPHDSRALRKMETAYRASGSEEMAQRYAMEAANREKKADKRRID
jgi:Flp pilus assembly protein TadD